jgi:hypothetical protein
MSTRRLKDKSLVPAKGWQALQEDGVVVKALSLKQLLFHVEQYRAANGLPVPPNIRRLVEEQICNAMEQQGKGEECGRCMFLEDDDKKNPPELRAWARGPRDLVNFAKAASVVLGEMAIGKPVCVSKQEAERRAAICSQCPHNVPIGNCWGCGELGRLFRSVQGGLSTSNDPKLESCDRCGCNLRTKVWVSEEALSKVEGLQGIKAEEFPSWCWRKEAGETITPAPVT